MSIPSTGWLDSSLNADQESFTVLLPEPHVIEYGDGEHEPYESIFNGGDVIVRVFNSSSFLFLVGLASNRLGFTIIAQRLDAYAVQLIDYISFPDVVIPVEVGDTPVPIQEYNGDLEIIMEEADCCVIDKQGCYANGNCQADGTHKAGAI